MIDTEDINDLARTWLAYNHIRVVLSIRVKACQGWFVNHHAPPSSSIESRSDDIVVPIENDSWYIHFRAGNAKAKLRLVKSYVENRRAHRELVEKIKALGIHTQVLCTIGVMEPTKNAR